jgi:Fringe-like
MLAKRLYSRIHLVVFSFLVIASVYYLSSSHKKQHLGFGESLRVDKPYMQCSDLPGTQDLVILLKTGVNEVEQRLPVLMRTLLKCAPQSLIFSDVEQNFQGTHIHDALAHILPKYLDDQDPDLVHYNRLQVEYVKGTTDSIERGAGWKLDRYKYMPMIQTAYATYPKAKWFVFIETDTAVVWSNLVTWLRQMDPQTPMYMGSEVVGGKSPNGKSDIIFAHGGSGFIISHAAAAIMVEALSKDEKKFFDLAKNDCCGDSALARAFWELNILLSPAYPNANGETPESTDYTKGWCFAPVFFHHMNQQAIEDVHSFDERKSSSMVSMLLKTRHSSY